MLQSSGHRATERPYRN